MSALSITVIGHWGAYPGLGEATSCYLLRSEGVSILLDCGSGALSQLQDIIPLNEIEAVVLSHYHADHIADLGCIQYAARIDMNLGRRKAPLRVFGHEESPGFAKLGYLDFAVGASYRSESNLIIGPFCFSFTATVHPDLNYAMRIECGGKSLVYTGDTGQSTSLVDFARKTDLLICEASLYNENQGKIPGHMSAGEAGNLAKEANAGMLVVTHLPHYGEHERLKDQALSAFGGQTLLARRMLTLEL
jgi:ribonuclease BN (tRNA processing enzyme)